MGDISIKGRGCERGGSKSRTRHNKGGRVGLRFGGGRTNLLEGFKKLINPLKLEGLKENVPRSLSQDVQVELKL